MPGSKGGNPKERLDNMVRMGGQDQAVKNEKETRKKVTQQQ